LLAAESLVRAVAQFVRIALTLLGERNDALRDHFVRGRPMRAAFFVRIAAWFAARGAEPCKEPRRCGFSALEFDGFAVQMRDR
jgi:hypothetical protein